MHSVELLLSLNYLGSFCVCGCAQSCLTLRHHRLLAASLLCLWNFPGKNTGMGCHFLLQRILPTQGLNPWSLHLSPGLPATFAFRLSLLQTNLCVCGRVAWKINAPVSELVRVTVQKGNNGGNTRGAFYLTTTLVFPDRLLPSLHVWANGVSAARPSPWAEAREPAFTQ